MPPEGGLPETRRVALVPDLAHDRGVQGLLRGLARSGSPEAALLGEVDHPAAVERLVALGEDGRRWVTERPISEKEYIRYLMESDLTLRAVRKTKYRFHYAGRAMEIDVYPFSDSRAVLFAYSDGDAVPLPPELTVLREVTGDPGYKNRMLAQVQRL